MLKKRIIPCLDIKNGRTVKGVNFVDIKDAGDPVVLAKQYAEQGADELVFLDITATLEKRKTLGDLVKKVAAQVNIPFTVGGGINSVEDALVLIQAGADKISINSSAVKTPSLITDLKNRFGSQFVVVAIDVKKVGEQWKVFVKGGTEETDLEAVAWAKQVADLGAGEILLTSMNNDGTKDGFALEITQQISEAISIPVIASGGAGKEIHFKDVFTKTSASAGLAASIFHFNEIPVPQLKKYLNKENIPVRM